VLFFVPFWTWITPSITAILIKCFTVFASSRIWLYLNQQSIKFWGTVFNEVLVVIPTKAHLVTLK